MAVLLFLVLAQLAWTYGLESQTGGGAYSYTDSSGKRYSGTYGLRDGQVVHTSGDFPTHFADTAFPGYGYDYGSQGFGFPGEDFYSNYFTNLQNLLQETFHANIQSQRLAYEAARKAYDLSSNQAGYFPTFDLRYPQPPYNDFGRFGGFGRYGGYGGYPPQYPNYEMPSFPNGGYGNSAYAGSAIGPGYRQQVAAINPPNPNSRNINVNVNRYSDTSSPGNGKSYHVASSSFASSSNINGQVSRKAETVVDDNGKITRFKVQD